MCCSSSSASQEISSCWGKALNEWMHDIVEAHCYFVTTGEYIDLDEHLCTQQNDSLATDCRTFWPHRPLYICSSRSICQMNRWFDKYYMYTSWSGLTACLMYMLLCTFNQSAQCVRVSPSHSPVDRPPSMHPQNIPAGRCMKLCKC